MKQGAVVAGRYTVERELGRGGMGAVWVARDAKFGARVALKVAFVSGLARDEFQARFAREARIGHRLGRTEGFVRALDWGEAADESLYLAMDLIDGARPLDLASGSLRERVERLERAARLVATAHELGVVHRDLKPANFLVDPQGRTFLADFGLAKSHELEEPPSAQLTRTGLGMGTPAYMPPEQFDDARSADERSDVYALGVMLFQALTGKLPYDGSPTAILHKQMRVSDGRDAAPRAGSLDGSVPAALDALCVRALELDRGKRLESARRFVSVLAAAKAGVDTGAPTLAAPSAPVVRPVSAPPAPKPPSSHVRPVAPPPAAGCFTTNNLIAVAFIVIAGALLFACAIMGQLAQPQ